MVSRRYMSDAAISRPLHINLWSNPKTAAVSLMYSFAQRDDTTVFDEPMYTAQKANDFDEYNDYLSPKFGTTRDDIDVSNNALMDLITDNNNTDNNNGGIYFYKNMAKQLSNVFEDNSLMQLLFSNENFRNILLVRDPRELVASFEEYMQCECDMQDTGYSQIMQLMNEYSNNNNNTKKNGIYIPVIKHSDLVSRPEHVLRSICDVLNIKFDATMLSWQRGGYSDSIDGKWGNKWYLNAKTKNKFDGMKYGTLNKWKYVKINGIKQEEIILQCNNIYKNILSTNYLRPQPMLWDARNSNIIVGIGGRLVPRSEAKVSVWDSSVWGGDAVWEGIRIYNGKLFAFDRHLKRLFDSAKATKMEWVPSYEQIYKEVCQTLNANEMYDNAHIRLTLTRGAKVMAGPSPLLCQWPPVVIVLAEWKKPVFDNRAGVRLVTVALRRNSPLNLDSKIHHTNMLNNILAKIQADYCDAEDALMLDNDGYVAETNATNIFIIRNNMVLTPAPDFCLPGITRGIVLELSKKLAKNDKKKQNKNDSINDVIERRISLSEVHSADEVFICGTMGELTPVLEIDGRMINDGLTGPITKRLQKVFKQTTEKKETDDYYLSKVIDKTITNEIHVANWSTVDAKTYWNNEEKKTEQVKQANIYNLR